MLWNVNWGPRFFPDTMSRNRFHEIMRHLRFDLKRTCSRRLQTDKFALASEVWQTFIDNCFLCYRPGENLTADEQLFPSKARCRFTQYMANNPYKFGIKILKSNLSVGFDEIPMSLIKQCLCYFIKPFVHIYNVSFQTGIFSDMMKKAKIRPHFKKGDRQDIQNY